MKRRDFFERAGLIAAISASAPKLFANAAATREIMIVSGWQSVNIGDIAHTIGLIRVFKRFLPNAKITIWKVKPDPTVEAMISGYFPDVKIITTRIKKDGSLSDNAFADASKRCDFLVHSSGPSLVGKKYIQVWRKHTQKPYGIFGITIEKITPEIRDIIENAAFFFTRETASLKILKTEKIANPNCAFVPDATFSFDVSDTKKAAEFFANSNPKLDDGKFVCVVPRLRYTPYWKGGRTNYSKEEIARREKIMAERWKIDRAKILKVIEDIFANTDCKVLLCPEMTYQCEMCAELFGLLKNKYAGRIGQRGYWLPDEAAAVYARAAAVVSFECHSPIIALRAGTPAVYLRQPEDTVKGQMYYDLPLSDWVFEIDETDAGKISATVLDILKSPDKARAYTAKAIEAADKLLKFGACETAKSL